MKWLKMFRWIDPGNGFFCLVLLLTAIRTDWSPPKKMKHARVNVKNLDYCFATMTNSIHGIHNSLNIGLWKKNIRELYIRSNSRLGER